MIAKLVLNKLLLFNSNRYSNKTGGCSSHSIPNSSWDRHSKLHSWESRYNRRNLDSPNNLRSKNGCKYNHHSNSNGHPREEIITDGVDKDSRLIAIARSVYRETTAVRQDTCRLARSISPSHQQESCCDL